MPAALAVDWSAVQATYAATGGNAEATAKAHDIDPATVRQRAKRGSWKAQTADVLARVGMVPIKPVSVGVTPCHEAVTKGVTDIRAKLGAKANLAAAKVVAKGMTWAAKQPGEVIVASAPSLASLGKLAQTAKLPEWESSGPTAAFLGLHVTVRADQAQVVDVDAEVRPSEGPTE
jgi:hypothetical protein